MNKEELSALLEKYLKGTCTPEEYSLINDWYARYESRADFTAALSAQDKNLLEESIAAQIYSRINGAQGKVETKRKKFYHSWLFRAAAAVVLIFIRLLFFGPPAAQRGPQIIRLTNNTQKIYRQVLPDQSIVYLHPKASLSYPKIFDQDSRTVTMNGDCFFEITKNPSRPFIIRSNRLLTKVWGTSFSIIDRKEQSAASVLVLTGRVSVSRQAAKGEQSGPEADKNTVMLYPNQRASTNENAVLLKETRADLSPLRLFEHTDLSFQSQSVSAIAKVLSERFSVSIRLSEESIGKEVMSANMNDLNLPEILDILKASMRLDYQIEGNVIYLNRAIKY